MAYNDREKEQAREREILPCPCKSKRSYGNCCMPYHYGQAKLNTAEELMRSRYSAYYFRRTEYLVETTHPDTREPGLSKSIRKMIHNVNWQNLTIVMTAKGEAEDKVGKVEFVADYRVEGESHQLHEISRFRKYKGQWKYLDGKEG